MYVRCTVVLSLVGTMSLHNKDDRDAINRNAAHELVLPVDPEERVQIPGVDLSQFHYYKALLLIAQIEEHNMAW